MSNGKELVVSATVADVMVATLKASAVRRVYGIPGDSPRILEIAMRAALQRGGVAVVVVPGEV